MRGGCRYPLHPGQHRGSRRCTYLVAYAASKYSASAGHGGGQPVAQGNHLLGASASPIFSRAPLLHEESTDQWGAWFTAHGLRGFQRPCRGRDSWHAHLTIDAARRGQGVALANPFPARRRSHHGPPRASVQRSGWRVHGAARCLRVRRARGPLAIRGGHAVPALAESRNRNRRIKRLHGTSCSSAATERSDRQDADARDLRA